MVTTADIQGTRILGNVTLNKTQTNDQTANGTTMVFTAGEVIAASNLCYYSSTGMMKTSGVSESQVSGLLGIATSAAASGATATFLLNGTWRDDAAFNFVSGAVLYASADVGVITSTKPTTAGQFVRIIGYALDADTIFFQPDGTYTQLV